ncbi:hypothetical protein SynBIOSU31_02051 [Synechococcus sp. BIOS-U3-1]|nr:hypothetical protein SynBIOSU31_02051 [Synechococcus sp. BIOS-U3-1]
MNVYNNKNLTEKLNLSFAGKKGPKTYIQLIVTKSEFD